MRIYSDWRDYYDTCQSYGQDLTLVYHRKESEIELEKSPFEYIDCAVKQRIVGFCGKTYPLIILIDISTDIQESTFCYKIEEVDEFVTKYFEKKEVDSYFNKKYKNGFNLRFNRVKVEKFFNQKVELIYDEAPIFIQKKLSHKSYLITFNPRLKDLEFFKVKDTFTAYQDLSAYLSNIAIPLKPIPEIPDEIILEAKGFDKKTSFRKRKAR